jgi:hypothetical protein
MVFSSLSAISAQLISSPSSCLMLFKQSFITVKAVSAKKSILSMPVFSRSDMTYWVVSSSFPETAIGMSSWSGTGAITTPAACTEEWRAHPSRRRAISINSLTVGLVSISFLSSGTCSRAWVRETFRPRTGGGISLAIRSTSAYGISRARPTSLIAALDARVPKVMIWQTESRP